MSKAGRPKIEIDWDQFNKLEIMQCTIEEIASWFGCSVDTIERRVKGKFEMTFAEHFGFARGKGKIAIRRKQYEVAMAGNVKMLIWLGKQYLDQKEKQEFGLEKETLASLVSEWEKNNENE